ncbi:hypothetical protein [Chryseobacterium tongliaoense]|uniref:hypothetical protein n=1 Tax=Chryseobacterium tongliaoense TaxID=3240933 RepID=UPI003511CC65
MKTYYILIYFITILFLVSCNSASKIRYSKAYRIVSKDFIDKESSIKEFGKDISGVYVYDSIYANPLSNLDTSIYKNVFPEKGNIKSLRKDIDLNKLSKEYRNKNWDLNAKFDTIWGGVVQYKDLLNGPLNATIFSEIKNDRLRIDVVPFFIGTPKYCGSVTKYYFKFNKTKIIETKVWKDHYECLN